MRTKVLSVILSLCMIFTIMPITAFAADQTELDISQGNIVITDDGVSIDGVATYANNANGYIITQTDPETPTNNTIEVLATSTSITIVDINIKADDGYAAFYIDPTSSVELTISGTNSLTGGFGYAGLWVPSGATVTIQSTDGSADDSLTAKGGQYGAGIGGSDADATSLEKATCGTVNIKSGTINATGGRLAAGIGGGYSGDGGIITISAEEGGTTTVTATGGKDGAGIGGGYDGDGGNITISTEEGGFVAVEATAGGTMEYDYEDGDGAGIGGGEYGNGGNIIISSKGDSSTVVKAKGLRYGAGIGSGDFGDGANITISAEEGGYTKVEATGGAWGGAGIGGGDFGDGANITISAEEGGSTKVEATGGEKGGAGIGGGAGGDCEKIEIKGSTVVAKGEYVGIGSNSDNDTGSIDISDSTIIATGGDSAIDAAAVTFDYNVDYLWRNTTDGLFSTTPYSWKAADKYLEIQIPLLGIALTPSLALNIGETEKLAVTFTPYCTSDKTIIWTSSDEAVATVDENGQVVAVGVGEATITVTSGEMTATCEITVTEPEPEETNGITGFLRMIKMILELIIYIFGLFAG